MHGRGDTHEQACPGKSRWLEAPPVVPLALTGRENVADLIDHVFAHSGFNARSLAEGAKLYARMVESGATIAVTVAGAMTPIGMGGAFCELIERGFVDFFIATGANLYHDLHHAYGMPVVQGSPHVDDDVLAEEGVARIYDVFIGEDETLMATDQVILRSLAEVEFTGPISTARLHQALGDFALRDAPHPERSFVVRAAQCGVPLYTSSPGDSSIGMNLVTPNLLGRPIHLDPVLDVIETTAIVRDAESNGVVIVGGGSPKNFYLQTQPTLHQILMDKSKGGHDYVLQLTVDPPHWGGLSGATPSEARSWGKLKEAHRNNVIVYSCASLTFPLIAQYVLQRCRPRPLKRLYDRLGPLTEDLRRTARSNPDLQRAAAPILESRRHGRLATDKPGHG